MDSDTSDEEFVLVFNEKTGKSVELPIEEDSGCISLSTLRSTFPHATGLSYCKEKLASVSRAVRLDNFGNFHPPKSGWGSRNYYSVILESEREQEFQNKDKPTKMGTNTDLNNVSIGPGKKIRSKNHLAKNKAAIKNVPIQNILAQLQKLKFLADTYAEPQMVCFLYQEKNTLQMKGSPILIRALEHSNFYETLDSICSSEEGTQLMNADLITKPRFPHLGQSLDTCGVNKLRHLLQEIQGICLDGKRPMYGKNPAPAYWPPGMPYRNPKSKVEFFQGENVPSENFSSTLISIIKHIYSYYGYNWRD